MPLLLTVVRIEHSSVTERIRSVGFDVAIVAVSNVTPGPCGVITTALSPAAVTLFAGVPPEAPIATTAITETSAIATTNDPPNSQDLRGKFSPFPCVCSAVDRKRRAERAEPPQVRRLLQWNAQVPENWRIQTQPV